MACCLLILGPAHATTEAPDTFCEVGRSLTFGFLPLVSAAKLVYRFSPLVDYLSQKLGVPIRLETAPNFVEFARRTQEEQRYDILFTAPHFFYQARLKAGYRLAASVDSPGMKAIIVVPKKSSIRTVTDLAGRRLATVPPLGLATLLVRKYLLDAGLDPDVDVQLVATPTHNASLLSSYRGATDASALMMPPYKGAAPDVRNAMRIIAYAGGSPHMPVSTGPWVEESCTRQISSILVSMKTTDEGRAVLKHNRFKGFVAPRPEIYDSLAWAARQMMPE